MLVERISKESQPKQLPAVFAYAGQGAFELKGATDLINFSNYNQYLFEQTKIVFGSTFAKDFLAAETEELNRSNLLQPAIVLANLLVMHAAIDSNPDLQNAIPSLFVGHSLGEWAALIAAGAIDFSDGMKALHEREKAMHKVPGKMMRVFGLDENQFNQLCGETGVKVTVVNGDKFLIAGGLNREIEEMAKILKSRNIRFQDTGIPVLSHHPLLAGNDFESYLSGVTFNKPIAPILMNAGSIVTDDPFTIRELAADQLVSPLRVPDLANVILNKGMTVVFEFGTKSLWDTLLKRLNGGIFQTISFHDIQSLNQNTAINVILS